MIAVDTSALIAIVLDEPQAAACADILNGEPEFLISAATVVETLIVATRRGVGPDARDLLENLQPNVVAVTLKTARRAASAYAQWGKGVHPASLNFGDCFAYEVARTHNCRLLYVGDDFARTDLHSALRT